MATRTYYFQSNLGAGELLGIRATDAAFKAGDLPALDTKAMHTVNAIIMEIAGPVAAEAILTEWMDDGGTLDPEVPILAELLAASAAFRQWEQYNLGVAGPDDRYRRPDSKVLADRAEEIARRWMRTKAIVKASGAVRYLGTTKEGGPIVTGPMREGSYFDPTGYTDPWGVSRVTQTRDPFYEGT